MRDISINAVETWGQDRSDGDARIAAIADIWQFRLDATMAVCLIVPPSGGDFSAFPCGPDAIGRLLFEVIGLEDNLNNAVEFYNQFRAQEKIHNALFRRRSSEDIMRSILISGAPLFNNAGECEGYRCTVSDVTAAMGVVQDIHEYEAILGAFIRHVPNLVTVKDVEGRFLAVNPLAERTFGVPRSQLVGQRAVDVLPPEIAAQDNKEDDAVLENEIVRETEQTFPSPDGERTFHAVKFPIFDADRSLVGTGTIGLDITEYKRSEEGIYQRANFDAVTGLPNRQLLTDRLETVIALARRTHGKVGVLMLDMGDFTSINEALGQIASDWLLIDVAATLRSTSRETDTVARLESDVFALILPNLKSSEELDMIAEKVLAALKEPRSMGDDHVFIQPSIGTTLFPVDSQQGKDLLHCAKMALGRAKEAGRGQVFRFKPVICGAFARRMKIESHLRQAIERNELSLAYQPIIDLASGGVTGAEALLRWTNTELGAVPPDEFIGVAEETGIIGSIGTWVLKQACRDAKKMNRGLSQPMVIAVNMSVKQLADKNIVATVSDILRQHDMDPTHLKIEMTESAFAGDTKIFKNALEGLRGLGLNIALDDFGTGYSSLSYLHRYRFHQLKIDKSFISNITARGDGYLLVENIIRMAHSLRLEVVAEGVETKDQVELLQELRCDKFQGYFVSKPVALTDFEKLLECRKENTTLAA